jgi:hypothetical protein
MPRRRSESGLCFAWRSGRMSRSSGASCQVGGENGILLPLPPPAKFSPGKVWRRCAIQNNSRNGISMFGTKTFPVRRGTGNPCNPVMSQRESGPPPSKQGKRREKNQQFAVKSLPAGNSRITAMCLAPHRGSATGVAPGKPSARLRRPPIAGTAKRSLHPG